LGRAGAIPVSKGILEQNQKLSSAKKQHKKVSNSSFSPKMKNLTDILPALPQVPAESIVRLGLSMVAYSAFNDTLRRQLDPANDRPHVLSSCTPLLVFVSI
jgi:hypothetical protein